MKRTSLMSYGACLAALLAGAAPAQDVLPTKLPPPQKDGGKPLMQALSRRRSVRSFSL